MGIKHFFYWFKNQFSKHIIKLQHGKNLNDINVSVDNLMIDMNGLFHNATQKVYQYGNHKPPKRFLGSNSRKPPSGLKAQKKVFETVCEQVEHILATVDPKKRLILCVDGPAPQSKQNQQRQRRFRSALERTDESAWDSCQITPGTSFMDYLSKYIDWYIRKRISEDSKWKEIEIVFSNEKAPGEGEHKIINYIRKYGDKLESYCIQGLDADLIMLAMGTHVPNFYILREDLYTNNAYFCIKIANVVSDLTEIMRWESKKHAFNPEWAINDFIFLCFIVGNDFLPHIPSIEIIQNGIELILEVCREVSTSYGHMTCMKDGNVVFSPKPMGIFLATIASSEKDILEKKLAKKESFFPDILLESCVIDTNTWELDIEKYRREYNNESFPDTEIKSVCHEYFEGMQWVLSYYTRGVPNWKWSYPYHYAPGGKILAEHIGSFVFPVYDKTTPATPYQQLLSVLPPKSANLIPSPLNRLLLDDDSPLKKYCPDTFEVDLAGKRKEWEGIVLLPMVKFSELRDAYFKNIGKVESKFLARNKHGKSFVYSRSTGSSGTFKSYYGDIPSCSVQTRMINL